VLFDPIAGSERSRSEPASRAAVTSSLERDQTFLYSDVRHHRIGIDAARVAHTMNPLETAEVSAALGRDAEKPLRER
jgi:hypothetical protein